jgi:Protein of unknown function (DUF3276)
VEDLDTTRGNLFSRKVRAGKRTYFFDVKATKSVKDFYITITESKRISEGKYERHKLFLYREDFKKFVDAITETVEHIEKNLPEKITDAVQI